MDADEVMGMSNYYDHDLATRSRINREQRRAGATAERELARAPAVPPAHPYEDTDSKRRADAAARVLSAVAEQQKVVVSKDTNPKDAVGVKKAPLSTMSMPVLFEVGNVMLSGARKYGRHNYRAVGVRSSVYFDAAMRHLAQWWEGEDTDPESGLPHLAHAMACIMVIRDSEIIGNVKDDRPPKHSSGWLAHANAVAEEVIRRYPDAVEPHTAKGGV